MYFFLFYSFRNSLSQYDRGKLSVMRYLPLIREDYITHMHGLPVYVKEGLLFARDLSLENSAKFLLMFSIDFTSLSAYFFFLY